MRKNRQLQVEFVFRNRGVGVAAFAFLVLVSSWAAFFSGASSAQTVLVSDGHSIFRVGEKLTYTLSFGKIPNAGYAETHVVSRGKIRGKDAVEIKAKVKTLDLVSAAFFLFDESRIAFAAPDTALPHYISTNSNDSAIPKETINNYLTQPTSNFDLLTLMYKARESGGIGTFPLFEGEQLYTATFQPSVSEKVQTQAGDFDTTVSTVQSEFFNANGIKELRINYSADEFRVPVLIRFKTAKGNFRVVLTVISLPEPELPTPSPTPVPIVSPTPIVPPASPTPIPYVENEPLLPELGFEIGEVLNYRVSSDGNSLGVMTLNAQERKLFEKQDSLLLTATITGVEPGTTALRLGDTGSAHVDPDTLTPLRSDAKFASALAGLNQTLIFDKRTGGVTFGDKKPVDAPIGTRSFVSLIYAIRSFNLKPSRNAENPVNDTRVAVFWEEQPYVFTLRPSLPAEIILNGEKVSAQLISITTGNKELDAFGLKVWLGTESRIPLRMVAGKYQADLFSRTSNLSK